MARGNVNGIISRLLSLLAATGPSPCSILRGITDRVSNVKQHESIHHVRILRLDRELRTMEAQGVGVATTREAVLRCFSLGNLQIRRDGLRKRIKKENERAMLTLHMYNRRRILATEIIQILGRALEKCKASCWCASIPAPIIFLCFCTCLSNMLARVCYSLL